MSAMKVVATGQENDSPEIVFGRNISGLRQSIKKNDGSNDEECRTIAKEVDYMRGNTHYIVTHFIIECCKKLHAESLTTATACCLFHKFFSSANIQEYDPYLIAGTCIYLAGKVEDNHLKLRDVINVVHATLRRTLDPLSLDNEYWNIRDAIVQTELFVLRMVGFQVRFSHPHKYLLQYLISIRDWMSPSDWSRYPMAQTAWKLLQDLYHDPHVLNVEASITALAIIQLVMEVYGIQLPLMAGMDSTTNRIPWFKMLNKKATKERLWEVMTRAIEVFNKEADVLEPISNQL